MTYLEAVRVFTCGVIALFAFVLGLIATAAAVDNEPAAGRAAAFLLVLAVLSAAGAVTV